MGTLTHGSSAAQIWLVEFDAAGAALLAAGVQRRLPVAEFRDPGQEARRTSHLVLRVLLARVVGIEAAARPFAVAALGKPGLARGGASFSLAHSGDRALIAIAGAGEIGADIEAPRSPRMTAERRDRIIAAACQIAGGRALPLGPDDGRLLQAWVRLEAVAKATGEGMGRLLTRLGVIGGAPGLETGGAAGALGDVPPAVRDLALDRGFHGAVAGDEMVLDAPLRVFPSDAAGVAALLDGARP